MDKLEQEAKISPQQMKDRIIYDEMRKQGDIDRMLHQAEDLLQTISLINPTKRMLIDKKEAQAKEEEEDILGVGIDGNEKS